MVWQSILTGRSLRLAFLLSLAINFFFIAVGASFYFDRPKGFPPSPDKIAERVAESLSGEGEKLFQSIYANHRPAIMAEYTTLQQTHSQVRSLASAEELDMEALRAARADSKEQFNALMEKLDGFIMDAMPQLTLEDRRRLVRMVPQ